MSRRRKFTPAFKAQVVIELLSGTKSSAELCRQHQLSSHLLARWKATLLERAGVVGFMLVIMLFFIGLSNDIDRLRGEGFGVR
jgi:transposase-like protein